MSDRVAMNLRGLSAAEKAVKGRQAATAAATPEGQAILGTPTPPEVAALDLATTNLEAKLLDVAEKEAQLKVAQSQVQDCLAEFEPAYANYCKVADARCDGSAANINKLALDVAGKAMPSGPTPRVMNLTLAQGDRSGYVDTNWDSLLRLARIYELQSTTALPSDPNAATWLTHESATKSRATLGPFPAGTRIWVRVRAKGVSGYGDWSDPATIIVA